MFGAPLVGAIFIAPDWGYAMLLSGLLGIGWLIWGITTAVVLLQQSMSIASVSDQLMTEPAR
jgi:hypothetical protein